MEKSHKSCSDPAEAAGNADLHHLLGATLAKLGDYARAESELAEAVRLNPQAHVARFQLGLLQLTNAQPQRAEVTWAALESLPAGAALRLFKKGLEALIRDQFADCAELLQKGIAANSGNAALNHDMRLILERLPASALSAPDKNASVAAVPAKAAPTKPATETPAVRTDFSLYTNTRH